MNSNHRRLILGHGLLTMYGIFLKVTAAFWLHARIGLYRLAL